MTVRTPLRQEEPAGESHSRRMKNAGRVWLIVLTILVTVVAASLVSEFVDRRALGLAFRNLLAEPMITAGGLAAFALAFVIRSLVWVRLLPDLTVGHAWAGIHVALAGNHVLPLRLGEPLRVLSVVRRTSVAVAEAAASTVTLRSADMLSVMGLAALFGAPVLATFTSGGAIVIILALAGAGIAGLVWTIRLRRASVRLRWPGPLVVAGTVSAWFAEAGLVWVVANATGIDLDFLQAVFVTSVSVAAQIAAVAPGGFGTYEAAAAAAYVYLGYDPGVALAAALAAHALKTAYAVVAGSAALIAPSPPLLGRMRLPRTLPDRPPPYPVLADQPVVVFMPAHDEEESVAQVLNRVPVQLLDHPVKTIIIDDGSTDQTSQAARAAGARVITQSPNRGLGAAVRDGLRRSLDFEPAAVVFLDADGEYAPEELARMVHPILSGRADYVVGSRFAGEIRRMLPHRRVGNRILTLLLSWVARRRIGDGQSGYRALSRRAAAAADIVHDYNYAQVLTLDLLAKGFAYAEVPISYHFRTTGRSFVRLGRYLRQVVPAVYEELNRPAAPDLESVPL